jgi:hypothetical protein
MKIEEKRVTFPKRLTVKYAGKIVEETDTHLTLEGEDEESYLKIFNPFRGVAKLLMFENDQWVDAETSIFLHWGWEIFQLYLPVIKLTHRNLKNNFNQLNT